MVSVEDGLAVTRERLLGRAAHAGAVLATCFDLDTLVMAGLAADLDTAGRAALEGSVRRSLERAGSAVPSPSARGLRVAFLAIDEELVMEGALGHARRHLPAVPMAAGPFTADAPTPGPPGSGRP